MGHVIILTAAERERFVSFLEQEAAIGKATADEYEQNRQYALCDALRWEATYCSRVAKTLRNIPDISIDPTR